MKTATLLYAVLTCASSTLPSQDPAPSPPVPPAPQAAPAATPATPEEAAWKVAMDLKNGGKGLQAEETFARFREQFPESKRCNEALVEMGVCWMMVARDLQLWHRNRPESIDRLRRATECFERVTREHAEDPVAARASYCQGLVCIQLGDLDQAWNAFTNTIEKYPGDKLYRTKSIERRSAVSRHRLETAKAQPDIELFLREVDPKVPENKEAYALVQRFASYAKAMDKPAPALRPEVWASSSSTSLESLKGEVVALYFFASWCHNCLKEAEFIHEMNERWGPLGVHFVGVTDFSTAPQSPPSGNAPGDAQETRKTLGEVQTYLAQHDFKFPVMMDRGDASQRYQARKYPELVLIDREGRVRWHDHPASLLDTTLERLLYGAAEAPGKDAPVKAPPGK